MTRHLRTLFLALLLTNTVTGASAQNSRGELLYTTYCQGCHAEKFHWRAKSVITDLPGLTREVGRWQAISNLDWSGDDIDAVVGYLNTHYYHFHLADLIPAIQPK